MQSPSVLVIDDEPDNFDVIETLLSTQGYQLHYVASGQDAISSLDLFQPDVILLDVMMPGMDGMQVCQRIKALPPWEAVPIIMVTALSTKEDLARCLESGADDFITKPVNSTELRARVKSMLRIKQQYDRIRNLSTLQENTIGLLQNNLDELCGRLMTTLPHELNTPLTGVLGLLEILIYQHQSLDLEEIHRLLVMARDSAQRLENLTKRFLKYTQLELVSNPSTALEASKPIPIRLSTQPLIEQTIRAKAERLNRLNDLDWNLADINIYVGEDDFIFIVDELLDNAFKFSRPNTPVKVSSQLKNGAFHLSIADQGRGLTEAQISTLGAFVQHERKYYAQQGVGLGLKIIQKMIEIYGGTFLVSSVYHQGTTVFVEFPVLEE